MVNRLFIRCFLAASLLGAGGCSTPKAPVPPQPLTQEEVDQFLAGGRDARTYGITIYPDAAGARFEFANRPHPDRAAERSFISPSGSPLPVIDARSAVVGSFPLLMDSSARQSWASLGAAKGLEYRIFAPPLGEYADHVISEIPGYAGVGNKLIFDKLHVESPIYYVVPAGGSFGSFARPISRPDLEPKARQAHAALARRLSTTMGAAAMRSFAAIQFDFPGRGVLFFSTHAYKPATASAVVANLPMLDWRGRPAVQGTLNGRPTLLVIDTAGDFDLVLSGEHAEGATAELALGAHVVADVEIAAAAAVGLPEVFPARLGLGVLADYTVTLDFKNRRVWFEEKALPADEETVTSSADETPAPVHYRGVPR